MSDTPSHLAPPHRQVTYLSTQQIPTVVRMAPDVRPDTMAPIFDETFPTLIAALQEQGIEVAGPAFSLHHKTPGATMTFELGFPLLEPLDGELEDGGIAFLPSQLPAARVATISHLGGYEGLSRAWAELMQRVTDDGRQPTLPFWEVYVTAPAPGMDPSTLRTDLVTPYLG